MIVRFSFGLSIMFLAAFAAAESHHPILPEPQRLSYGHAAFPLSGIIIGFKHEPADEDIFAARELATIVSGLTGSPVRIEQSGEEMPNFLMERTGESDPLPMPGEKIGPASREAYRISIGKAQALISARSSAGLYYGVQTIRQMIEGSGEKAKLPECELTDWPSMAYRGFMMDMSHAQLPRVGEIKAQIDFLARWKANQYFFYSEASIELEGYPLLMANARFTREQVADIIGYARQRHIDVIPNMELYGHLHDLFRLEHFADMAVIPHGGEFSPNDPRIRPLLEDWITQVAELFPSPFFHIGFDETWLIEKEAEKLNLPAEALYLKMLRQTTGMVEQQGKVPLVWADMLQKYPSIIPEVSEKTIAVPWHYWPREETDYDRLLGPFTREGIPMIVQSALINWNWVYPAFEVSFENTDLLIRAGRKYDAIGFINSGWTDDTQTIMRMSRPDLAYGSAASWQGVPMDRENFYKNYARIQYPAGLAEHITRALHSLMESESLIRSAIGNTDPALFANPFTEASLKNMEENRELLRNGRLAAEVAQVHLREAIACKLDTITLFAILTGAKTLDYLALKYIYAAEIADFWKQLEEAGDKDEIKRWMHVEVSFKYHTRTSDMLDAVTELKEMFRKAWLNEYTTFRLGVGLGKYDLEFQYWLKLQRRLDEVRLNYRAGDTLPTLESLFQ
jgi:hexosaminidase